jgi:hypothetical protein
MQQKEGRTSSQDRTLLAFANMRATSRSGRIAVQKKANMAFVITFATLMALIVFAGYYMGYYGPSPVARPRISHR